MFLERSPVNDLNSILTSHSPTPPLSRDLKSILSVLLVRWVLKLNLSVSFMANTHLESISSLPRNRDSDAHLKTNFKLMLPGKYLQSISGYPHARVCPVGLRARFTFIVHGKYL